MLLSCITSVTKPAILNAFGISRGSVSLITRKVSKAIVEFLGKDYMKSQETVPNVDNLTQKFLEHHGFPQCIGAIDGTHTPICQPNQNYADYISRKGFTSINVQSLCDYRYCFLDVVVKWPGSVHDSRIFLQSNINQKLQNKFVPSCEKQIVESKMKVSICILGDTAYPLLPFLMKEYPKGGKDEREQYFGYRLSSARMVIENTFGRLKGRFGCLRRPMDVNIKELPRLIMSIFILHDFCEVINEMLPNARLQDVIHESNISQPNTKSINYKTSVNESEAKKIRSVYTLYLE